jgi:hypothetical protein
MDVRLNDKRPLWCMELAQDSTFGIALDPSLMYDFNVPDVDMEAIKHFRDISFSPGNVVYESHRPGNFLYHSWKNFCSGIVEILVMIFCVLLMLLVTHFMDGWLC